MKLALLKNLYMPVNETGHSKNIANLKTLIEYLKTLPDYKPSKAGIQVANLQKVYDGVAENNKTLSDSLAPYSTAVDAQEALFKPFNKLLTRVIKSLRSSVDDPAEADTAESLRLKIAGERKSAKKTGTEDNSISVSQRSYDNQLKNFNQLITTLKAIPAYSPNENELNSASLNNLATDMQAKVSEVSRLEGIATNARIARNKALYTPKTGVVDLVATLKEYVGSAFGATSPELKYITRLKFSNNK